MSSEEQQERKPHGQGVGSSPRTERSLPKLEEGQPSLSSAIAVQSLLAQFAHPDVRGDFINGRFGLNVNSNLLPRLDELRWSIFPRWQCGSFFFFEEYGGNRKFN